MGSQDNKSIVQAFYDQWNTGAIDFEDLVDQDVVNHHQTEVPRPDWTSSGRRSRGS